MPEIEQVLEYKCPCCDAPLTFNQELQKMSCAHCDNTFEMDAVKEYNESLNQPQSEEANWNDSSENQWSEEEQESVRTFTCNSCGGVLITNENTAATFCPYCDNPTIIQGRLSGEIKPDAVLPFRTSQENARKAFLGLCKNKLLLPKGFTSENRLEKITAMYVPFWLYDCECQFSGTYRATRTSRWSDSKYHYTKTDHYSLLRKAEAEFKSIPVDGSSALPDSIMESIEPFDFKQLVDFDTAYLSGYLAEKYDVEAEAGRSRVKQRIESTMDQQARSSIYSYGSVSCGGKSVSVTHGRERYVLLPVWMLYSKYRDKTYVFAMNGQTGKMTGVFPICPKKSAMWFSGVAAGVTLLATLAQYLMF